jgi:hypothetical protein
MQAYLFENRMVDGGLFHMQTWAMKSISSSLPTRGISNIAKSHKGGYGLRSMIEDATFGQWVDLRWDNPSRNILLIFSAWLKQMYKWRSFISILYCAYDTHCHCLKMSRFLQSFSCGGWVNGWKLPRRDEEAR